MNRYFFIPLLFSSVLAWAQGDGNALRMLPKPENVSFRGMSPAPDGSLWLAGAKGLVVRNSDDSVNVTKVMTENAPDLRSIWAFDAQTAVAVGIGSPAYIFRTADGGQTWKVVHTDTHPEIFLDGIAFRDKKNGFVYGDPIVGKMTLLETRDGGMTWKSLPEKSRPNLEAGEASFAASGTGIKCMGRKKVVIATGGTKSRLWISENRGKTWRALEVPILQGKESQGIFSFDFADANNAVVVGGDYLQESLCEKHVFITSDGGKSWHFPEVPTRGYRECVRYLDRNTLIACGPTGFDISRDGGRTWQTFSDERGFHVCSVLPRGNKGFAAGAAGRFAVMEIK